MENTDEFREQLNRIETKLNGNRTDEPLTRAGFDAAMVQQAKMFGEAITDIRARLEKLEAEARMKKG
jgi:hypothetical protein